MSHIIATPTQTSVTLLVCGLFFMLYFDTAINFHIFIMHFTDLAVSSSEYWYRFEICSKTHLWSHDFA